MVEVSYDALIDKLIEARKEEASTIWKQAAVCYYIKEVMGVPAKTIASDVGLSGKYISELVKTHYAFPDEESRAADQSFSIHKVCAQTDDPVGWLDCAVKHAYSVRELKEAINEGKPDPDPLDKAERLWGKVEAMLAEDGPGYQYLIDRMVEVVGSYSDPQAPETKEEETSGVQG